MSFTEEEVKAALNSALPGVVAEEWVSAGLIPDLLKIANALPAKIKGEPIDRGGIREGDKVVRTSVEDGMLVTRTATVITVFATVVALGEETHFGATDDARESATYRLIHRPEAPKLPTEAPAVIFATEVRGVKGEWWLTLDHEDKWRSAEAINGWFVHLPMYITAWKPADFVVRES